MEQERAVLISDILRQKTTYRGPVLTIGPGDPVTTLLRLLTEHGIGALVVVDTDGDTDEVVGIVSERDVVRQLADRGATVLEARVGDIMTSPVLSCAPGDSVDGVAATMTERRVRHMPVLDDAQLVGIVSIGDVVFSRMHALEQDREHLEQYITG
jgi:CBS domain-containing protein